MQCDAQIPCLFRYSNACSYQCLQNNECSQAQHHAEAKVFALTPTSDRTVVAALRDDTFLFITGVKFVPRCRGLATDALAETIVSVLASCACVLITYARHSAYIEVSCIAWKGIPTSEFGFWMAEALSSVKRFPEALSSICLVFEVIQPFSPDLSYPFVTLLFVSL
jgi:hypothetical protein